MRHTEKQVGCYNYSEEVWYKREHDGNHYNMSHTNLKELNKYRTIIY